MSVQVPNRPAGAALYDSANALFVQGDLAAAEQLYRKVVELHPRHFAALNMLGVLASAAGRPAEAHEHFARAVSADPWQSRSHNNLGIALTRLNRFGDAVRSFDAALRIDPGYADAFSNRGVAFYNLRRTRESLADFNRAIALQPDNAHAHYHRGLQYLAEGNFESGWPEYEWRKRLADPVAVSPHALPALRDAAELAGKELLIYSEQGLGDTIHFCRYAKLAAARGARVTLAVPPQLRRLMSTLGPGIRVVSRDEACTSADLQTALLSLPLAFRSTAQDIPHEVPYLGAEPELVTSWRQRLGDHRGLRVGLCWHTPGADTGRSLPLAAFGGLASIPGVQLFSLQKSPVAADLEGLAELGIQHFGDRLDAGTDAFLDTAALMQLMDVVITADTSTAHLAGALACPTWIALRHVPDWRWRLTGSVSDWYPTARLFRQPRHGDWEAVCEAMRGELTPLAAQQR